MSWNIETNGAISSKKSIFHLLLQIILFFVDKIVPQHLKKTLFAAVMVQSSPCQSQICTSAIAAYFT